MALHNDTGTFGEDLATNLMVQKGYTVLERNWKMGHLEVDIIVKNRTEIVFVEVKTRRSEFGGVEPEEYVDSEKQQNICNAASAYVKQNNIQLNVRFDIVGIVMNPLTQEIYDIRHIENAYYPRTRTICSRTYSGQEQWHTKISSKRVK